MVKKNTKKRNPQDVTVRNVRAGLRRDRLLDARVSKVELQVARLMNGEDFGVVGDWSRDAKRIGTLELQVAELTRREGIAALQVAALQAR